MYVNVKTILRHKDWRKLLKKIRRKIVRKKEAEERDEKYNKEQAILRSNPAYLAQLLEEEEIANEIQRREELEAIFRREQWRIRDLTLHKNWLYNQERKKKLDQDRKLQEETIRIEWEEKLANEAAAKKKISDSENELLKEATRQLGDHSSTHNPEPPVGYVRPQIAKAEPCPFFAKTGACRFGYNCSRDHAYPMRSNTILLPNMYTHFGLEGAFSDDYDMDISLEYSESDSYKHFREFFFDVLPEFEKCGKVVQFKVCSNKSAHLKGNVYVQFNKIEAAEIAYGMFNGRWYAGRQISCVFVHIEQWKPAICGLHFAMKCPKGGNCNFLHVYRNPGNAFFSADRDWLYDKKAAVTPRSERRKSRSRSRDRNKNGSSSRRNKNYSGSESRRRKNRDTSRSISSERLFYGTKHLTKRKSRSRSIDKRKSRRKSTEAKIISSKRSTNKRKSRSRSTNQRKSRSRSTERRKSKSSSTDRIKSKLSSLGRRKSRSSSVGRRKSRLKSTDDKRISSRSTNTNKSRSKSTDRRKSRSRSTDRRKSRSRSTDRRKSRSRSTDRRKSRSKSAEMRKSRSRSTEMSKSRSGSTDSSQSRSGSTDR